MQDNDQRSNIKKDTWIIIVAILIVVFIFTSIGENKGRVYDCGMAEWHPDIPNAVKEECRRIHYEEWRKQQEESKRKSITT